MLILPIKKKWFEMIKAGEKKEEYREIKTYYRKRFQTVGLLDRYGLPTIHEERIVFRNGYSATSPQVEVTVNLDIKKGKEEWGALPNVEYYVLKIVKIHD